MVFYTIYINGNFYGRSTNPEYMTELFRDYVEYCCMYEHEEVNFKVTKDKIE